jgi:formate-dependent nitrite reductase membrane component NrfD
MELTTTRHNPLIDPALHIWSWQIPVYLFLGGLAAGLMILSGYHILRDRWDQDRAHGHYVTAPLLSLALLSLGMLALFLDLEHKLYVWRLYLTFKIQSPMSWGSWILLAVYPALGGSALMTLPEALPGLARRFPPVASLARGILARPRLVHGIGLANVVLGILLGIYTGILLSSLGARPLWNSALLGPLFLFSGLSTGAATLHVLAHWRSHSPGTNGFGDAILNALAQWLRPPEASAGGDRKLVQADNSFLTAELCILLLFLGGLASSSAAHQQAARLLLSGPYAAAFWVLVIGLGILLPLALQVLQTRGQVSPGLAPAGLVIAGGLALRFILVYAGQASHWTPLAMN